MGWPLRIALVRGPSMVPTLRDGDRVLVWLRRPRRTPKIGAVVLVDLPDRPLSIKRVAEVHPDGRISLAGDNPHGSTDSRELGALAPSAVQGIALLRLWPRPGRIPQRGG
jgi:nickel-type superoxide dismutase maturation protease